MVYQFNPNGLAAEDRLRAVLFYQNVPHRRATRREDQRYKIDFWIWHHQRAVWVKTQVTISNDPEIFASELEECLRNHVVYLALNRQALWRAIEHPQSAKAIEERGKLIAHIFLCIDEWLEHDPEAASTTCQLTSATI